MQITKTITVTVLDKPMNFTDTEYSDFLNSLQTFLKSEGRGCSGKCHDHDTREFDHVADEPDQLVELDLAQGGYCNEWIRIPPSMQELLEMKEKQEVPPKPMNVNIVKDTVLNTQRPKPFKKDVTKYAKMIVDGEPTEAIKNLMLRESFCAPSSIPYFFKQAGEMAKTLKADKPKPATFVTVISNDLTETQILNSCYAANHSQIPVEHCKAIARFGYDLEQNEIVFRGQGLGKYDPKEILAVYDMTHTEETK